MIVSKTIKLLKITHNYPRYRGDYSGPFVPLLAKQLLEHGIEPVILAPHDAGAKEEETDEGVKIYRFRYAQKDEDENLAYQGDMHKLVLGSVGGIFKFKHFLDCFRDKAQYVIERENIDAIVGHWLVPSGMVIKTVNRQRNLPAFIYSHGTDIRLVNRFRGMAYRYLRDFCLGLRRWLVVSGYLRQQMVQVDGRLAALIDVLPLPQDESVFYSDETVARDGNLVLAVTRYTDQKRVGHLIRAFALVCERRPATRLEIYASGPRKGQMIGLIDKLGLQQQVTLFEPVSQDELRTVYNRATVVVLNSVQEGFGLVLSEAMLCGTAVIGAASGGITDIIEQEKRGLLVEPDNVEHLAGSILRLLEDIPLRERLARAGHDYARQTFTSRASATRFAEIIRRGIA